MTRNNDGTFDIRVTSEELFMLDGKCSKAIQTLIDTVKAENVYGLDAFANQVISEAIKIGELDWHYMQISSCEHCGKLPRYIPYKSNSRYHKKGEPNFSKPWYHPGVRIEHMYSVSAICCDCWNGMLPQIIKVILDKDLPVEIRKNEIAKTRYVKDVERVCYQCGKTMWESEMSERPTIMGNGRYKAGCPHCGAESLFLGDHHKQTGKFRLIKAKQGE